MNATVDAQTWGAILQPVFVTVATVVVSIVAYYLRQGIQLFQQHTGIRLEQHQQAIVDGAVNEAAGTIITALQAGQLSISDIQKDKVWVQNAVNHVRLSAQDELAALAIDPQAVATKILGALGNKIAADPSVPTVPVVSHGPPGSGETITGTAAMVRQVTGPAAPAALPGAA